MVKKIAFTIIVFSGITLAFTLIQNKPTPGSFAVVELFTSEGCSSCPPADALISRIEKESKEKPVYILAYHVDYWDRLGWKDSFSNARYSQRQNQYANWLHLTSVYTPQIVVNGTQEFIGSQEKTLRNSLKNALAQTNSNHLEIALEKQTDGNISLSYQTKQQINDDNLVVAIVIPNAKNKIERGENKGKTLSHVQIVSSFETFNLNGKEKGVVNLASGKIKNDFEVIAFLQNVKTGKITAAAKRPLKLLG